MFKKLLCFLLPIFIIGCNGDSSQNNNNENPKNFQITIENQNVEHVDIKNIGLVRLDINNISHNNITIYNANFENNSKNLVDTANSTCFKNLNPNENCQIILNINEIYSTRTNVKLNLNTSDNNQQVSLFILNSDWDSSHLNNLKTIINKDEITKIDVLRTMGQLKLDLTNYNKENISISEITINNPIDTLDSNNTTCIKNLTSQESCQIILNINGIYTSKTNVTINLKTSNGGKVINIPIWNYNWNQTQLALLYKDKEINSKTQLHVTGDTAFTLVNTGQNPIYIDTLTFDSYKSYNKLITSENSCGGTLNNGDKCYIHIDFKGLYSSNVIERLIIGYRDGEQKFELNNYTNPNDIKSQSKFNCKTLGNCILQLNHSKDHKIVLLNAKTFNKLPVDFNLIPSENNGCTDNLDITNLNACSLTITANKFPATMRDSLKVTYRYYINETDFIDDYEIIPSGIDIYVMNPIEVSEILNYYTSGCVSHGGKMLEGQWWSNAVQIKNVSYLDTVQKIIVKSIEFTPSATNYECYAQKTLIKPSEAVLKDGCSKTTLGRSEACRIDLQAGCEGYGSEGQIKIVYNIENSPTEFTIVRDLADVLQPEIVLVAGEGEHFNHIWQTGQQITQPIHVTIPPSNLAGLHVRLDSWRFNGTYTRISRNYLNYMTLGVPDCFGNYGRDIDDDFYPTGINPWCGIGMDFSKEIIGTSIPFTLWLGNRAQDQVDVIFDFKNVSYVKPVFKGDVK
jgi:hypothetical protein